MFSGRPLVLRALVAVTASTVLAAALSGCGGDDSTSKTTTNAQSPATDGGGNTVEGPAPVEFNYLGLSSDKQHIHYTVKVLTDKKIFQVDLGVKYMDGSGKVLDEERILWQNIVKSKQEPITNGKSYDVEDYLFEGATKADAKLLQVVFDDGSRCLPK